MCLCESVCVYVRESERACLHVLHMAVFVSVMNNGWLMRFLNRLSFTYSAAR